MARSRRTRFVCISDTHNSTVKLPAGDVLIHAGDLTNQGSYSELSKTVAWLEAAPFEAKIVIAGNHDITLDEDFYSQHGSYFHNQNPQSPPDCLSLLASSPTITYLNHASKTIRLTSPQGPHTKFKVFGSPYAPRFGTWAFYYDAPTLPSAVADQPSLWDSVPLDADVVVTHTPAKNHRDEAKERRAQGCEALRRALWRVRPLLHVCGHIHEGRGAETVTWDLGCQNVSYAEKSVAAWHDPGEGSNKLSLVDLTGRKGPRLQNDGSHPCGHHRREQGHSPSAVTFSSEKDAAGGGVQAYKSSSSTIGLGGDPASPRSDYEALFGRMGRKDTCVVNAAIMKSLYPHVGGKKFYKPIVVDVGLPVWESDEDEQ